MHGYCTHHRLNCLSGSDQCEHNCFYAESDRYPVDPVYLAIDRFDPTPRSDVCTLSTLSTPIVSYKQHGQRILAFLSLPPSSLFLVLPLAGEMADDQQSCRRGFPLAWDTYANRNAVGLLA